MRWRPPPPSFPMGRPSWSAFDVAASLFVVLALAVAGALLWRGVDTAYFRVAIVWMCVQIGALGLVAYFWIDRSRSSREAMRFAAIGDFVLHAVALAVPSALPWAVRLLATDPLGQF